MTTDNSDAEFENTAIAEDTAWRLNFSSGCNISLLESFVYMSSCTIESDDNGRLTTFR